MSCSSCSSVSLAIPAKLAKPVPAGPGLGSILAGWIAAWRIRSERRRQLAALLDLDDRLLNDIGLDREQAIAKAYKPFWR